MHDLAPTQDWSAEDFADLNAAVGLVGPQAVPLIPGKKPIVLDLSRLTLLAITGQWGNPLIREKREAVAQAQAQLAAAAGETAPDTPPDQWTPAQVDAIMAAARATLEFHDTLLAAVVIAPPYQDLASVERDGARPDALNVLVIPVEARRAVQDLAMRGVDALARFRADPAGFIAGFAVQGLAPEPGDASASPDAAPSGVLAERGAVAPPAGVGGGAVRGGAGGAPHAADRAPARATRGAA